MKQLLEVRSHDMALRPSPGISTMALEVAALADVANAWRPFDRHGPASIPVFAAAWPTSELPLPALGAHAATTALAARHGGFRGSLGIVNAGLATAAAAGLIGLQSVARSAAGVYESALVDGLGPGYRER